MQRIHVLSHISVDKHPHHRPLYKALNVHIQGTLSQQIQADLLEQSPQYKTVLLAMAIQILTQAGYCPAQSSGLAKLPRPHGCFVMKQAAIY